MPRRRRTQIEPTEDWDQLRLRFTWAGQTGYKLIRPVVLFGRLPVERAQETEISARTSYRKANRCDEFGMVGLFSPEPATDMRVLPPAIRPAIVELQAQYPAFRPSEAVCREC